MVCGRGSGSVRGRCRPVAAGVVLGMAASAGVAWGQSPYTFVGVKSGKWTDPVSVDMQVFEPNWSPSVSPPAPPNGAGTDVTIPTGKTVDVNGVFTVGRIAIAAGSVVHVGSGLAIEPGAFAGSGVVTNGGSIELPVGTAMANGHTLSDVTLTGGGSVAMTGGRIGPNNTGYNGRFVNANNTIGGYGVIGFTFGGGGRISFTNQGVVQANVAYDAGLGNELLWQVTDIDGPGTLGVNSGTVRATNGGRLVLAGGTIDNTGGFITSAGAGSNVVIATAGITGGTLSTVTFGVPAGSIETADLGNPLLTGVTIAGRFQVTNHSSARLLGTINNTGTIAVASLQNGATSILSGEAGGAVLTGGGVIQFENVGNDNRLNGVVTNVNNTIRGVGEISGTFTNQGLVDANVPYVDGVKSSLQIIGGFTNAGTVRASGGGRLSLEFTQVVQNAGGTIEALNGSAVVIAGNQADIRGGTLTTSGSGVIQGSNVVLRDLTNAGNFTVGTPSNLYLDGTIQNTGSINLPRNGASTAAIILAGNVTLGGSGSVNMTAGGMGALDAGLTLTNAGNTIRGTGQISNNQMDVRNQAAIVADVAYVAAQDNRLTLAPGPLSTNSGVLRATGGGFLSVFRGNLDNTGGTVEALNGSNVRLTGVRLTGGTLATTGTGVVELGDEPTLVNMTSGGSLRKLGGFGGFLVGTFTNNGTFVMENSPMSVNEGNVTLAGNGTVTLNGSSSGFNGNATGKTLTNQSNTIQGAGRLGGFGQLNVVNHALVDATDPAVAMEIWPQATFTNAATGTLRASGAAGINVIAGEVVNAGLMEAKAGSKVLFGFGRPFTTNGGTLKADGLIRAGTMTVNGNTVKSGAGVLRVTSGLTISAGARLDVQAGTLVVEPQGGSSLASVAALLAAAYDKGKWDLPGLTSSTAAGDATRATTLGFGTGSALGIAQVDGEPVSGDATVVRRTWYGDLNLDGSVNAADANAMGASLGTGGAKTWTTGDLNFDQKVTADDFALLAWGAARQTGGFPAAGAVPEPAGVAGGLLLFGGRRRRTGRGGC